MKISFFNASTAFALVLISQSANATVSAHLSYSVPFAALQTDDRCLGKFMMIAELGIPPASTMEATFAPTSVYRQILGFPTSYADTNVLTSGIPAASRLKPQYISDTIVGSTVEYSMNVNVTPLSSFHGLSPAGRQKTIKLAKLSLLAMSKNLEYLSGGNYRLRMSFTGLPSQAGLSGTPLNASTVSPYSSSSTLLTAYRTELINNEGSCPN